MTRSNYANIELGKYPPSVEVLHRLSKLTGISMNDLIEREVGTSEIPKLPIGKGGKAVGSGRTDYQRLEEAVKDMQLDMEKLKEVYSKMDEGEREKMNVFTALQTVINYLEKGVDDEEYREEKKAYLARLAAHLSEE